MKRRLTITANAPVTLLFALICLIALVLNIFSRGMTNTLLFSVYRSSLLSPFTYLRFFLHVFGHAGWDHFLNNMLLFVVIGPMLEEKYGSKRLIFVILITAVITGIVHFILFPGTALLGASGVVFAFILLASFTEFRQGSIPLTFIIVAVLYIGNQIYQGLFTRDNISNLTHILGGVVGAVSGFTMNRR